MEHHAFHVPYLLDTTPEAAFHGQAVKTVVYLRVSTTQQVLGPEARTPEGLAGRLTARWQGGRNPALPRTGRFQDRHRQVWTCPVPPSTAHEHPRAQAEPLACISTRILSVPLLGKSAEHTHERDLVRETQLIVVAPTPGDLASVGREKGGIANQAGAGNVRVGDRHGSVRNKRSFLSTPSYDSSVSNRGGKVVDVDQCQGRSKIRPLGRSKSRPSQGEDSFLKAAVSGAGAKLGGRLLRRPRT